jgi:organic radical activating enzyme
MFRFIRVQILYPCNASCSWCATHRKNPLFRELYESGISEQIHAFYSQIIKQLKPEQVFVSGGEPLLYPEIAQFLNEIRDSTEQINLFTSYQFSKRLRSRIDFRDMPLDKIVLCHTTIAFEPNTWHAMTGNFPFDLYVENILEIARQPVKKRFKFIINHDSLDDEIRRFQSLIETDQRFEFGLKVINDQGGGINESIIQKTKMQTKERVLALDERLAESTWGKKEYRVGSIENMRSLLDGEDVSQCRYRNEPIELRFAFYRSNEGDSVLKYRYCPYFPSDFGHRFHIGRDDPKKLKRNYIKGSFHDHCKRCRFLKYADAGEELESDSSVQ